MVILNESPNTTVANPLMLLPSFALTSFTLIEYFMDHVWDNSVDSFSNSIRVHISALRKKLRAVLGYDPIRNRIGEGYLMGGEEE